MRNRGADYRLAFRAWATILALGVSTFLAGATRADTGLAPQTKLRITVVQWMPTKGTFETWGALGGDVVVSPGGTVSLPVIGVVPVGSMDTAALSAKIADTLQKKMGLVDKPNATVEILEYPPVYVVGDVSRPGEYRFHEGLTVLQALALGGGVLRASTTQASGQLSLVGELRKIEGDKLRASILLARLQSELASAPEITVPADIAMQPGAAEIIEREKIIFAARAKAIERQSKSFEELRELLNAEIVVLNQKIADADQGIKSLDDQLTRVKDLVEKGMAITSRQSDLERNLALYRADRLDQVTAVMRARQAISEATRNLEGLHDQRQTEVATELQNTQANLKDLMLRADTDQKLLLEALAGGGSSKEAAGLVSLAVVRKDGSAVHEMPAEETTILLPGDVVKVSRAGPVAEPARADDGAEAAAKAGQIGTGQVGTGQVSQ